MENNQLENNQSDNRQSENIIEEQRLAKTLAIAKEQLKQAENAVENKQEKIIEAKKEARENSVHSFGNLYNSEEFEALAEFSQYMNAVTDSIADCEEEQRKIFRLEKLLQSPYFARIDFRFVGEDEAEPVYIGRSSLMEKNTREMYVYDWRSPIASVFYRFMTGKAFYDAPAGTIEGEVTRKRQYEIEKGKLEYFFDTDRNISDEFLKQMLSKNTSPQMKAIVETIQREQDIIIRDMESDLLMVQGVAGSGKTSIALHRAAYLMYQGLQNKLSANNILIVSPNSTFEQYISSVLPELGEENVDSIVFEDILEGFLKDKRIQSKNEYLESVVTNNRYKQAVKKSIERKTSMEFMEELNQFLLEIPEQWVEYHDIYYDEKCVITSQEMREWVLKRPEALLGTRLEQLEDYVLELIFGTGRKRGDGEERNWIKQEVQQFTRFDIAKLYKKKFMGNVEYGYLYYEDAIAITYLYLKIHGTTKYQAIRQVVIDEAQDYYPLQFEIFRMIFPNAKFTILGDINQTLAKQEDISLYERIQDILGRKNASLITLDKSFRCTNEILEFGLQFIEHRPEIESFNRAGEKPAVTAYDNQAVLLEAMLEEAAVCKEKGYKTICFICKTEKNARNLFEELKSQMDIQLIKDKKIESLEGTFIMPVYMSKGLEFDAVTICDADASNYCDADDKKLLYVECTRALHRLNLFCEGELSPLIVSEK